MKIRNITLCVAKKHKWIEPILMLLITLSAAGLSYNFPEDFKDGYPIIYSHLKPIVEANLVFLITFAMVWLFGYLCYVYHEKSFSETERKLDEELQKNSAIAENIRNLFDGYLYHFGNRIEFGSTERNCERVTLYIHDGRGHFVPFGRYSANPCYKSINRGMHPDNEGFIAEGWQHGWAFDCSVPEDDKKRIEFHASKNMKRTTSKKLRMPSLMYAVSRITDSNGSPVAVIVIESTEKNRFDEDKLRESIKSQENYICEMVKNFRQYIPVPDEAKARGL